ncbi:MAG: hypothetical protein ABR498_03085 [Candidatus Dormibacteria bacterium]
MTPRNLVLTGMMVGILAVLVRRAGDPDIFWHLRTAEWMLDNHAFPPHDLYTFTVSTHPWLDHDYLAELLIAVLYRIQGFTLVSIVFGAVTWLGFWFILKRIRVHGAPYLITALAIGVGALAANLVWGPRPQMFTFMFLCVELYLLETFIARRSKAVYWLPLIVVVWANFHTGVVIGLVFLGLTLAVEAIHAVVRREDATHRRNLRILGLITLGSAVAILITPEGFGLYRYAWENTFSSLQESFVREWHSPDFHMLNTRPFELAILLLLVGFAFRRPRLHHIAQTLLVVVMGLQSVRHIALFAAASTPVLAWSWGDAWEALRRRPAIVDDFSRDVERARGLLAAGLAAIVIATAAFIAYTLRAQTSATAANFPVAASEWLAAHPNVGTRMFNEYAWGGYLAWRFYPDPNRRVFIYGETIVTGDALLTEYADVFNLASDWHAILVRENIDYAILIPDSSLAGAMEQLPGWHTAYQDSVAIIFVRDQ